MTVCHALENKKFIIKPVNDVGIMFEPVAIGHFYMNEWTVFTSIEIPSMDQEFAWLHRCIDKLEVTCRALQRQNQQHNCQEIVHQTWRGVSTINNIYVKLISHSYGAAARQKRSFFDGAGGVIKLLFGNLDAEDGKQIYQKLDGLNENQKDILLSLNKQLVIVKSVFNENKRFAQHTQEQASEYEKQFINLTNKLIRNTDSITALDIRVTNMEIETLIGLVMSGIKSQLDDLLDITHAISIGKLHPKLLAAETFLNLYRENTQKLNDNEIAYDDYQTLSQVLKITSVTTNKVIHIKIVVPVPDRNIFEINKIFSIPINLENNIQRVPKIEYEYLAVAKDKSQMILMNNIEFSNCQNIITMSHITQILCKETEPRIDSVATDNCVISLYMNDPSNTHTCQSVFKAKTEKIIKLVTENSWLYIINNPKTIKITCKDVEPHKISINETSIIKIEPNCKLIVGSLTFKAKNVIASNITIITPIKNILPKLEFLPNVTNEIFKKENSTLMLSSVVKPNEANQRMLADGIDWDELQMEIKRIEENRRNMLMHENHQMATYIIVLIIIVIIVSIVIFGIKYYKSKIGFSGKMLELSNILGLVVNQNNKRNLRESTM